MGETMKWLLLALCCLIVYLGTRPNQTISISKHTIRSSKLSESLDGYTIVQISDLHNALFGKDQTHLIEAITTQNPSLIVLTGDMVANFTGHYEHALTLIEEARKIAPVLIVAGNHEARQSNYALIKQAMIKAGAKVLEDTTLSIDSSFSIFGLKEKPHTVNKVSFIKEPTAPSCFHLILAHHPEDFKAYVWSQADLVLTGHAHGGQFRFFGIGLYSPDQGLFPRYTSGAYVEENTTMIVSRGLGESALPLRLFNGPELVVITLYHQ